MELAELLRIQDALDLRDTHLIFFARDGFAIAHTDVERASAKRGPFRLEDCAFHIWTLDALDRCDLTEGLWRLDYGEPFDAWPHLVALDVLSHSPYSRPKIEMYTERVAAHDDVAEYKVTRTWSYTQSERIARDYNAMVDELEILSAALVAKGADPKRILKVWRGEG